MILPEDLIKNSTCYRLNLTQAGFKNVAMYPKCILVQIKTAQKLLNQTRQNRILSDRWGQS